MENAVLFIYSSVDIRILHGFSVGQYLTKIHEDIQLANNFIYIMLLSFLFNSFNGFSKFSSILIMNLLNIPKKTHDCHPQLFLFLSAATCT